MATGGCVACDWLAEVDDVILVFEVLVEPLDGLALICLPLAGLPLPIANSLQIQCLVSVEIFN